MNKPRLTNKGTTLEARALHVLRAIPGLQFALKPRGRDGRTDAELRFGGRSARVAVEFKTRANPATAWQLVQDRKAHPKVPILLIANETTAETRAILKEHGIAVIDGLGNAHVELPGMLIHLAGTNGAARRARGATIPRLQGRAGVVAQALLLEPERAWQIGTLAATARTSVGLAHRVLTRLEHEDVVAVEGTGPNRIRRLVRPAALIDLWAEEQGVPPIRTLAHLLSQTPRQLIERLGRGLEKAGIDHALTGTAGAALAAPLVTAIPVAEVWVTATAGPADLYRGTAAEAVNDGQNVVFLQAKDDTPLAFRERKQDLWLANRFRLYADLLRDPRRGREQAQHLREEVIGF